MEFAVFFSCFDDHIRRMKTKRIVICLNDSQCFGFRLFSKKYPIVIFLKSDSFIGERNTEEKEHHEGLENDDFQLKSSPSSEKKSRLFLFARCDRQKEEW